MSNSQNFAGGITSYGSGVIDEGGAFPSRGQADFNEPQIGWQSDNNIKRPFIANSANTSEHDFISTQELGRLNSEGGKFVIQNDKPIDPQLLATYMAQQARSPMVHANPNMAHTNYLQV